LLTTVSVITEVFPFGYKTERKRIITLLSSIVVIQLPGKQKTWVRFPREEIILLFRSVVIPSRCYLSHNSVNTVDVLYGNGNGTFLTQPRYTVGQQPRFIASRDFNNDSILDIAMASYSDNTFSILLGSGNGTFPKQSIYAAGAYPVYVISNDFDFNGVPDLV
jgi:hypothetical protein